MIKDVDEILAAAFDHDSILQNSFYFFKKPVDKYTKL